MNKLLIALGILAVALWTTACTDILETNISEEAVKIIMPLDSTTSKESIQTFWWEELEGASSYRLTVVSPDFANIQRRVIDAVITDGTTSYDTTLISGSYQWTLVGENTGYTSEAKIYTLTVESDTSSNLAIKSILLTNPASDYATKDGSIAFRWNEMTNADNYTIQVASPDFTDNGNILVNELVQDNNYTTTLTEGTYRWRVRGENSSGVSPFSERGFSIDQTPPNAPQLISPADDALVTLPTTLTWTPDTNSDRDTVYVYSDSLQNNLILKLETTDINYSFNDSGFTSYFWRVRSLDAAGNVSSYSGWRKFRTQ